jgi:hypothetical protein
MELMWHDDGKVGLDTTMVAICTNDKNYFNDDRVKWKHMMRDMRENGAMYDLQIDDG